MSAARYACVLVLVAAVAEAGPRRKEAPSKLEQAAGRVFDEATQAEEQGNLSLAARLYVKSLELAVHPFTVFNLAEVRAAQNEPFEAIILYQMYLALEPGARDRAEVEGLIAALRKKPSTIEVVWQPYSSDPPDIDPSTAYVIVDGRIVSKPGALASSSKPPPLLIPTGSGRHTVDLVTAVTYDGGFVDTKVGQKRKFAVSAPTRVDGNLVVHTTEHVRVTLGKDDVGGNGTRTVAAPGKHRVRILDRYHECPPATFEIAKGDAITYYHVAATELPDASSDRAPSRCRKLRFTRLELPF